jgi:hypothetical protein
MKTAKNSIVNPFVWKTTIILNLALTLSQSLHNQENAFLEGWKMAR